VKPILVADLFAPLNDELVALLRGLDAAEWNAPTVAGSWTVKDIAAHLLDTSMRRLSGPVLDGTFEPNRWNSEWVTAMRRVSPPVLIELIDRYGREAARFLASLDPLAPALIPVTWAGDDASPAWFDVARELTERWHHQQQIRDATGRPPLYDSVYFAPVIETFVYSLPLAYRDVDAPPGTTVLLRVTDEGNGAWSLVREDSRWTLWTAAAAAAAFKAAALPPQSTQTIVTMRGDTAWRLFTRQPVADRVQIEGPYGEPLLKAVAII